MLSCLLSCSKQDEVTFQESKYTFSTFYNDRYFDSNNEEVSMDIALASHAMALATFNGDPDYTKRSYFLRDLWNKENFKDIRMNGSFYERPGTDTIGFGLANKKISLYGGSYTLIAIAVRGGFYEGEWTSNLTIGEENNAKGFDDASSMVIEGLQKYIADYRLSGHLKFWISGFSRAAITSNMTAGKILNMYKDGIYLSDGVNYTEDDVYAYCFEPPMGVDATLEEAASSLYKGIHNFLNYNDVVPLVAPYQWGFVRYGKDHYYPDRLTDIYFDSSEREKLITYYHFTYGADSFTKYTVDEWKFFNVGENVAKENNLAIDSIHPSLGRFLHALVESLAINGIGNRSNYSPVIESGIRKLLEAVMGYSNEIEGINLGSLVNIIFEYAFIRTLLNNLLEGNAAQFAIDIEPLFLQIFGANEDNIEAVKYLYADNFGFFIALGNCLKGRQDLATQLLYRDNAMGLIIGHIPELSYAFLSCCNPRILGDRACKFSDGSYQTFHIDNPGNVTIYEKNLGKNVFLYADGVMQSDCLSAERYADGSIDVYLPYNGDYQYECSSGSISLYDVHPLKGDSVISENMPLSGEIA